MQPGDDRHGPSVPPKAAPRDPSVPRGTASRRPRRTWWPWVAGVLVSAGILIGLFALGTGLAPAPEAPSVSPSSTPSPSASVPPSAVPVVPESSSGPVGPGEHAWDLLRGGECLQPFESPWAETFTVVDCESPHEAQMVFSDVFPGEPDAPYPGADVLGEQITLLCGTPDVIDFAAAENYTDIQVEGTYPMTQAQWDEGQRSYYCFVSRSSGDPIEGSLAAH